MHDFASVLYSSPLSFSTVLFRLLLITVLSGAIGFERGYRGRAAGLRTHVLVGIGSATTVMTGIFAVDTLGYLDADPLRIAAQVVSGIGFLGVGTILVRGKTTVTGLTTAAGLWTTAAISIAIGIGFYSAGLICASISFFAFALLTKFERAGHYARSSMKVYIECSDVSALNTLMETLRTEKMRLREFEITPARSGIAGHMGIEATMLLKRNMNRWDQLSAIAAMDMVVCAVESV